MYGSVQLGYAPGPAAARALLSAVEAQLPAYDELQLAMVATALAMMEVPPPDSVAARLVRPLGRPAQLLPGRSRERSPWRGRAAGKVRGQVLVRGQRHPLPH